MKPDLKKIIPARFQNASFMQDVPEMMRKDIVDSLKKKEGIYLWGMPGCGKTHIAYALMKDLIEHTSKEVLFYNTGDFLEKLRDEFNGFGRDEGDEGLFRETMNFDGILFFDDIGAEKETDWVRERLYLIINKKYEDRLPMIFTSNCDMEILSARLGDRITSRVIGMAKLIQVTGTDKRVNEIN